MGTSGKGNGRRERHRGVDRIAALLEAAARTKAGLTLSELAATIGAPVSSTQSLVNGLVAAGYLDEWDRRYTLGSATYLLHRIAGRPDVAAVSHAHLEGIHARCGLTTVLAIAVGPDLVYVDYVSTDPRFALLAENLVRRPLIRASGGWLLLAGMDRRDLWAYLEDRPADDRERVDHFLAALAELVDTGVCASPRASDDGDGVSIAVRDGGRVGATIGIIGDREVIVQQRERLVEILTREARAQGWSSRD